MDNKPIDRRVRKTKKLLLDGLTRLMSEKKINKITVKELTDLVDVNRATFYLYYNDIFDMVEKIETDMIVYLMDAFEEFSNKGKTFENALCLITRLFEYIKEYSQLCKILLGPDGDYAFVEKLKSSIKTAFPDIEQNEDPVLSKYYMPFIISGCIGAIQLWLEDDMKTSIDDMAAFVLDMSMKGVK